MPHAGGRPEKPVNLKELEKLAMMQCTDEEIAAWFDITPEHFCSRIKKRKEVKDILAAGKAKGRASLRHAQFQKAIAGNATMLIWMGKQILGQRDQMLTEHTGELTINDAEARDKILSKLAGLAAKQQDQDSGAVVN